MSHREIGEQRCMELFDAVRDLAEIEVRPRMDGRTMAMLLAPLRTQTQETENDAPSKDNQS